MSFIEINNLTKEYNNKRESVKAISDISISIESGDFISVMGPSGSGKSTFLTTIGGLSQPTSGEVFIDELNIFELRSDKIAKYRNEYVGFIFQSFHLLKYLTVNENIMLPLAITNLMKIEKAEKCAKTLEKVGLQSKAHRMVDELSGGEQQRVAVARALVNDPLILLADEPTGNLDSNNGNSIMELFCSLNEEGKTIIIVTHDKNVESYAKRKIYFRDGRIIN